MAAPALERCVGDVQRFVDDVWARGPILREGADPDGFADLLTLDDVDHIVSSMALRLPAFRLIKNGATLPESMYTKSGRAGSKPMTGLADPARIPLPYPCAIHDFALTPRHAVFYLSPHLLDVAALRA